ncbi:unnamed protein product [Anisakis simplex]|uniref:Uncharacterized protein n=1 Tax=Anisakis simplex TaxID=6269 RepID=A0A0M3JTX6_ANISI|nr:unnamed protein product [Anisakis simplex]
MASSAATTSSALNGSVSVAATRLAASHQKRSNGTFRVVSDECAQFSLDEDFDDEENGMVSVFPNAYKPEADQPLICNQLDSDNDDEYNNDSVNANAKIDISRTPSRGNSTKEFSRLTDEVEVDGDSASDELDLLPPLPTAGTSIKLPKWKALDWICCKSRVPVKCVIM